MTNGTLQIRTKTGGGIDANGEAIPATGAWSDDVDCFIQTNGHSNKGKYADGKFTIAAYTVLIESQTFNADRIKLVTQNGEELGEFQVQDVQFLDTAGRVKITV